MILKNLKPKGHPRVIYGSYVRHLRVIEVIYGGEGYLGAFKIIGGSYEGHLGGHLG